MTAADFSQVKIPGFKILNKLGQGAMAQVFLAMQVALDRKIALKIMAESLMDDPEYSERFLREAKIVAQLSHPHIISVYDVGIFETYHYLAMEYHNGGDLKQRIRQGLSINEAINIVKQIANALDFAHREGYVHRDVKPENILFDRNNHAILTDFGIACSGEATAKMTAVGTIMGTPKYMSPEQARGMDVDGRSDIYSLGVILYELLAGSAPYLADNPIAICHMHTANPIPELPSSFARFQPLVAGCMAKSVKDRIATGREMISLMDELLVEYVEPMLTDETVNFANSARNTTQIPERGMVDQTVSLSQSVDFSGNFSINSTADANGKVQGITLAKPKLFTAIVSFILVLGLSLGYLYIKQGGDFDLLGGYDDVVAAVGSISNKAEPATKTGSIVVDTRAQNQIGIEKKREAVTVLETQPRATPLITAATIMAPQSKSLCSTKEPYLLGRRVVNENDSLPQGGCFSVQVDVARDVDLIAYSHSQNGTIYQLLPNKCNAMGLGSRRFQGGESVSFPLDDNNNLTVIGLDENSGREWIYVAAVTDSEMKQAVLDRFVDAPDVCGGIKGGNMNVDVIRKTMEKLVMENAGRLQWLVRSFNHGVQ